MNNHLVPTLPPPEPDDEALLRVLDILLDRSQLLDPGDGSPSENGSSPHRPVSTVPLDAGPLDHHHSGERPPTHDADRRFQVCARLVTAMPVAREPFEQELLLQLLSRHPASAQISVAPPEVETGGSYAITGQEAGNRRGKGVDKRRALNLGRLEPITLLKSTGTVSKRKPLPGQRHAASATLGAVGLALVLLLFFGLSTMLRLRQGKIVVSGGGTPVAVGTAVGTPMVAPDSASLVQLIQPVENLPSGSTAFLAWAPNGSRLAAASETKADWPGGVVGNNEAIRTYDLKIWDTSSASARQITAVSLQEIKSVAWSPDGRLLAVGLDKNTIKLYSREGGEAGTLSTPMTGEMRPRNMGWGTLYADAGWVRLAWSPNGRMLATSSGEYYTGGGDPQDGMVRLWDPTARQIVRSIRVPNNMSGLDKQIAGSEVVPAVVNSLAWSPDGSMLAGTTGDEALVWNGLTGEPISRFRPTRGADPSRQYVSYPSWSPDGKALALTSDRLVELWDVTTGALRKTLPESLPPSPVPTGPPATPLSRQSLMATVTARGIDDYTDTGAATWSPDGRYIATYSLSAVRVWDPSTGARVQAIASHAEKIEWSPDGKLLTSQNGRAAAWESAGTITFWDPATGQAVRTIGNGNALDFAWSHEGGRIAVSTADGLQIWGALGAGTPEPLSTDTPVLRTTPQPCGSWQAVESPSTGGFNWLTSVAAISPDDAWAVGFSSDKPVDGSMNEPYHPYLPVRTLIEHWDGNAWSIVPSPNMGDYSYLMGVTALDKAHAWAVGYYTTPISKESGQSAIQQTFILSWDGKEWQTVSGPASNVGGAYNRLTAVSAVAQDDVWAVGSFGRGPGFNDDGVATLLLHFDGKAWIAMLGPNPGVYSNHLIAVSAVSRNDAWAVGFQRIKLANMAPLVIHWDGKEWTPVPLATAPGSVVTAFNGVSGLQVADTGAEAGAEAGAWITGGWRNIGGGTWQAQHLDAGGVVSDLSPYLLGGDVTDVYLSGVEARAPNDVWAVGAITIDKAKQYSPPDIPPHQTLALHWNGREWGRVASPSVGGEDSELSAIGGVHSANAGGDLWAVGSSGTATGRKTLITKYSACAGSVAAGAATEITEVAPPALTALPNVTRPSPTPEPTVAKPLCDLIWSKVELPGADSYTGIAALSSSDVWAVGFNRGAKLSSVISHWNGTEWKNVRDAGTGEAGNQLYGVAALSPRDVWAVGYFSSASGAEHPLTEHWDGVQWTAVPNPDLQGVTGGRLNAVAALSSGDVWAVGIQTLQVASGNVTSQSLVEHWNGTAWRIVASPSPGDLNNSLNGIAAVSSTDIWAVGSYDQAGKNGALGSGKTLVLHWNGVDWRQVASPNVAVWSNSLLGVAARTSNDAWAVGLTNTGEHVDPLTLHWDGKLWSVVSSPPSASHDGGGLTGVVILSASDTWAVGGDGLSPFGMHWDGHKWNTISLPNVRSDYQPNFLAAVSALSSSEIWSVGGYPIYGASSGEQPGFALRYSNVPCGNPATWTAAIQSTATRTAIAAVALASPAVLGTSKPVCWSWIPLAQIQDTNAGDGFHPFSAMAALSDSDAWVSGTEPDLDPAPSFFHWDGQTLSRMPSDNLAEPAYILIRSMVAVSHDNVWAVGQYQLKNLEAKPLIMHWDGSVWRIVSHPANLDGKPSTLWSVAASATDDVWAVGERFSESLIGPETLAMHWNGKAWSIVPSPNPGSYSNSLRALSIVGKNDIWAVGDAGIGSPNHKTLAIHWDGSAWSVVPSADPSTTDSRLMAVVALSKDDVWSTGQYSAPTFTYPGGTPFTMMQHWDGTSWKVAVPGKRSIGALFSTLVVGAPDNIWALGSGMASAHWDGREWTELPRPDFYGPRPEVNGAIALSGGEILTVGNGIGRFVPGAGACASSSIGATPLPLPLPVGTAGTLVP